MADFYVKTEKMTVGYRGVPLIEDIEIQVNKGQILTLIGPNGAGKSTILKSIIRQLELVAGTVYIDGQAMSRMSEKELARTLSVLMTDRIHPELMSCEDVVSTGRYPYTGRLGVLSAHDREVVRSSMELVHTTELKDKNFNEISDGQRQRVLLARAICQEPEVIVLDEPTSFLDIRHKLELLSLLKQMVLEKNIAVIMSLHELDLAQRISDRVVCVRGDHIDRFGPPEKIFTDEYIRRLYGVSRGSYQAVYGTVELEKPKGEAGHFVIGGGGKGIPVYRHFQRKGVPFYAGILQENDLDYPVAQALAAEVISVPAFAAVDEAALEKAKDAMLRCRKVVCALSEFGALNQYNKELFDFAVSSGLEVKQL